MESKAYSNISSIGNQMYSLKNEISIYLESKISSMENKMSFVNDKIMSYVEEKIK